MAKLKDDPAVQALIAKALEKAAAEQAKALKAQVKLVANMTKATVVVHVDEAEDRAVKKALKGLGNDLLAAIKEA
jgi:rRNA-processing protein FCF1